MYVREPSAAPFETKKRSEKAVFLSFPAIKKPVGPHASFGVARPVR